MIAQDARAIMLSPDVFAALRGEDARRWGARARARALAPRAVLAQQRAIALAAQTAIRLRATKALAIRLQMPHLLALYDRIPPRRLLVPLGGGQQFRNDFVEVRTYKLSDMDVAAVKGEIDLDSVHILDDAVSHLLSSPRNLPLLLNLGDVRYLDSTALYFLLKVHQRCQTTGRPFAVVGNKVVRRICGVLSLQAVFPIFPNTTLAREYFVLAERKRETLAGGSDDSQSK